MRLYIEGKDFEIRSFKSFDYDPIQTILGDKSAHTIVKHFVDRRKFSHEFYFDVDIKITLQ